MNTTVLFLSTALALFNTAPEIPEKLSAASKAAGSLQLAQPAQPDEGEPAQDPAPMRQAVEPDREVFEPEPAAPQSADPEPEADPLPEPEPVNPGAVQSMTQMSADRAEAWFATVETLRARFVQTAPDGTMSAGTLSLQRPGRARFDYDDPSPILLVADGSTVAIADFALETIDRAPIGATPMRFLIGEADRLSQAVVEAGRSGDRLYVTLVDPEGEVDGRITLVFDDADPALPADEMALVGWFAVDAMGGLTEINLTEVERGVSFDPRLFILDDEDVMADDRRSRRR